MYTRIELQNELSAAQEQLHASTAARLVMAHTIADLRTENATLRGALKDALTVIARQRYGPRFQTLTDEGEAYTTS